MRVKSSASDDPMHQLLGLVGKNVNLFRRLGFSPREALVAAAMHLEPEKRLDVAHAVHRLGWVRALRDDENPDELLAELVDDNR